MKNNLIRIALLLSACCARGQGTVQYDQQSSTNEPIPIGIGVSLRPGLAQSFIPNLSSVGFIRLYLDDPNLTGAGATVSINLLDGPPSSGTLRGSTTPVFISPGFVGYTNFFFSIPVTVNSGTSYYFAPILQSGDSPINTELLFDSSYPNGTAIIPPGISGFDLWFREGIAVPEPSSGLLVLLGITGYIYAVRNTTNPGDLKESS